jgi:hypothetical protein
MKAIVHFKNLKPILSFISFVRLNKLPVFLLHLHARESPAFPILRKIRREMKPCELGTRVPQLPKRRSAYLGQIEVEALLTWIQCAQHCDVSQLAGFAKEDILMLSTILFSIVDMD